MIGRRQSMLRDEQGASAVEFAVAIPVLAILIVGILQLGILFFANAGLQQAVESGARFATISPSPSDSAITAKVTSSRFGLDASRVTGPTISHGTTNGVDWVDVTMSYAVPLNMVFFQLGPITLTHTRRAYQP